ncbi:MAG TPA: helicase-related protein [Bacteroidales bacterium]|nr:helicase-related protein [Bacteroidales bacterium]
MTNLEAKYKFGFSATPKRGDGLTQVIHYATGPTIHVVPKEQLVDVLIKPSYKVVETSYTYPLLSSSEYQYMISDLSANFERNSFIQNYWIENYSGKSTIMLCLRLTQLNALHSFFPNNSVMLHSLMKKADRKKAIDQITTGEKEIVISTYGLFSTGIDVPRLEVLMLCAPIRSEIKLKQSAGRLMRLHQGKTSASIVDFADKKIDLLKYQFFGRQRILKNL